MRLGRLVEDLRTAATMPRVGIVVSRGGPVEEECLRELRSPHPRLPIVPRKAVGAALLPLDDLQSVDDYLAELRYARRRVRRASRLGYTVATFDPDERRSELLAVHTSLPERQGRRMDPEYLDPDATLPTGPGVEYLGVFRDDVLVAYCRAVYAGDIVSMDRVLGHGEHLANGIMFLLTAGLVERVKRQRSQTRFVYYDMFFGATDGLREFKTRAGFRPHWVRWRRETRAGGRT